MFSPILVVTKVRFQQIRKEEKLQHEKEYEQFDQDDGPQSPPKGHFFKAIYVELYYFLHPGTKLTFFYTMNISYSNLFNNIVDLDESNHR